jgi:Ca2+-transporting ATPase
VALSIALQAAVLYLSFLQHAFATVGLTIGDWLLCIGVASSVLWLRELNKLWTRAKRLRSRSCGCG